MKLLSKLEEKFGGFTPFVVVGIATIISTVIWCLIYVKAPVKMSNERDYRELHGVIQSEWPLDTLVDYKVYPHCIWVVDSTGERDIIPVVYSRVKGVDTIRCVSFIALRPTFLKWRVGEILNTRENIRVIESEAGLSFTNELNWIDDYKRKFGM